MVFCMWLCSSYAYRRQSMAMESRDLCTKFMDMGTANRTVKVVKTLLSCFVIFILFLCNPYSLTINFVDCFSFHLYLYFLFLNILHTLCARKYSFMLCWLVDVQELKAHAYSSIACAVCTTILCAYILLLSKSFTKEV